ncbi:hypothetical protein LIER_22700 [Lithospermum erythrorhizon]|uniref:Uncharacterized protein n=1 Tax=Lithospermum erythrorhizon TaxID=34254 RepID=A0AAV3QUS2_LITER
MQMVVFEEKQNPNSHKGGAIQTKPNKGDNMHASQNEENTGLHSDDGTSVRDDINLPDVGKKTGEPSVTNTMDKGSKP